MVKSFISILAALLLFAAAVYGELSTVNGAFSEFEEELSSLSQKIEEKVANGEDAKAVRTAWERHKTKLHIWIPHNDIMRVDDLLSETVVYVAEGEYALANAKMEVLHHVCKSIPATYFPLSENIL